MKVEKVPVSAFVTHLRKQKNREKTFVKKKAKNLKKPAALKKEKKKHLKLANILPTTLFNEATDINLPSSKDNTSKSKKKTKQANNTPINGNSSVTSPKTKKSKKSSKTKSSTNDRIVDDSQDATLVITDDERRDVAYIAPSLSEAMSNSTPKKSKKANESIVEAVPSQSSTNNKLDEKQKSHGSEAVPNNLNNNPIEEGKSLFQWLIHPVSIEDFFQNNWEQAPLQINRSKSSYYKLLMTTPMLDNILRNFNIRYTENIDITSYADGQRETHNCEGRAMPSCVWDYYSNGCSIRMLNPQSFIPKLHALNASLQEFFGCFVGANSYLTPPDSQGFAPHYDDIEAFILQIEGKKRWRLYKPRSDNEYLPRYSSKNFSDSEIGEPILDTVVNAGDLLYFPRGTIHQGETIDGSHSLHITLSVYQKNSWADFLEALIPDALRKAIDTDSTFREGLPLDYLNKIGIVHSAKNTDFRKSFVEKTKDFLHRLVDHIDIDKAADLMARRHMHDFLPPILSPREQECSILKDGERMTSPGVIENRVEIDPDTRIRLLRSHCVRLMEEGDSMTIYYSTENSKVFREYGQAFLEVDKQFAPAIKKIIQCYPNFIRVDDLPIDGEDNKVQLTRDLWERCIVVTDSPLPVID